jgi:hypothetical protein
MSAAKTQSQELMAGSFLAPIKKPPVQVAEIQNFGFRRKLWTAGALACMD